MLAKKIHSLGISSDILQFAGIGSVAASIATWRMASSSGDRAHAERFGIFVGLWAPTFFALANQLVALEAAEQKPSTSETSEAGR